MPAADTCCTIAPYFKVSAEEALQIADITHLEVHGPAAEVEKLRAPIAHLQPQFFILEYGFRR